ncbi:DUF2264 domain-containing protein [Chitinophagaceae bacterium LWZ2-11]
MKRRNFIKAGSLAGVTAAIPLTGLLAKENNLDKKEPLPQNDREYWSGLLYKMSEPVLRNLSKGELRKNMQVEYSPIWDGRDKGVAYMECFGRLIAGLAPWLALPDDNTNEGKQRKQLREWALQSYKHAVDPNSPDYLTWRNEAQPLVDAAYIAHSFIRAPKALWEPLDATTKERYINEFKLLRRVRPAYSNWLLFAATVEAFLLSIDAEGDAYRVDMAVKKHNEWYVGDGWYSDGPHFHFDYYNGYVIQPMMVDVLSIMAAKKLSSKELYNTALKRMQRYADFLERLISPEGTYPAFGRSVTYRVGAFQPLTQLALTQQLPEGIKPAQVRSALTAVMKRMFTVEGIFNKDGYLQLGFAGHQPNIADYYSNSGSMYITSLGFLPLGLPADHEFWTAPPEDWTSKKAWSGQPFRKDYAVDY